MRSARRAAAACFVGGVTAAILHVLREAAENPLIKAILTSARGADPLLPFLTTRSEMVLQTATAVLEEWARAHAPGAGPDELAFGAESIVRLVVSASCCRPPRWSTPPRG